MTMPDFPIGFRTLEGGVVTLKQESKFSFPAHCGCCGESKTGELPVTRAWANTHAGECRAIPQTGQAQPGR